MDSKKLIDEKNTSNRETLLKYVFTGIYEYAIANSKQFEIFDKDSQYYDEVFDVCLFMSLSMFIHDTTRIKKTSIRKFLYYHSPNKYPLERVDDKPNSYYFDYDYPDKASPGYTSLEAEVIQFRLYRNRLYSDRAVYNKSSGESSISKSSEYEISFIYDLIQNSKADADLADVFKRLGNLYNDVDKLRGIPKDEKYKSELRDKFKRFLTKVDKVGYSRFLNLYEHTMSKICEDDRHYGINLYRNERLLRFYRITREVDNLLKNETDVESIKHRFCILHSVPFPSLYVCFGDFTDLRYTKFLADTFNSLLDTVVVSSRLILDDFVDGGHFGDDWESFFLDTINQMADSIFYIPSTEDFILKDGAEEKFQKLLIATQYDLEAEHLQLLQEREGNK